MGASRASCASRALVGESEPHVTVLSRADGRVAHPPAAHVDRRVVEPSHADSLFTRLIMCGAQDARHPRTRASPPVARRIQNSVIITLDNRPLLRTHQATTTTVPFLRWGGRKLFQAEFSTTNLAWEAQHVLGAISLTRVATRRSCESSLPLTATGLRRRA